MTVKRLLAECDSAELTEWWQHFQEEPWPWVRADAQAALAGEHWGLEDFNSWLASLSRNDEARQIRQAKQISGWKTFFAVVRGARSRNSK